MIINMTQHLQRENIRAVSRDLSSIQNIKWTDEGRGLQVPIIRKSLRDDKLSRPRTKFTFFDEFVHTVMLNVLQHVT